MDRLIDWCFLGVFLDLFCWFEYFVSVHFVVQIWKRSTSRQPVVTRVQHHLQRQCVLSPWRSSHSTAAKLPRGKPHLRHWHVVCSDCCIPLSGVHRTGYSSSAQVNAGKISPKGAWYFFLPMTLTVVLKSLPLYYLRLAAVCVFLLDYNFFWHLFFRQLFTLYLNTYDAIVLSSSSFLWFPW